MSDTTNTPSEDQGAVSTRFSPTDALRLLRPILADKDLSFGQRIAVAAIVLGADNRTGVSWGSYRRIAREFGLSFYAIAEALRTDDPAEDGDGKQKRGKAVGKYIEVCGRGKRGSVRFRALPPPERSKGPEALPQSERSDRSSALIRGGERSGSGSDSYPSASPRREEGASTPGASPASKPQRTVGAPTARVPELAAAPDPPRRQPRAGQDTSPTLGPSVVRSSNCQTGQVTEPAEPAVPDPVRRAVVDFYDGMIARIRGSRFAEAAEVADRVGEAAFIEGLAKTKVAGRPWDGAIAFIRSQARREGWDDSDRVAKDRPQEPLGPDF